MTVADQVGGSRWGFDAWMRFFEGRSRGRGSGKGEGGVDGS